MALGDEQIDRLGSRVYDVLMMSIDKFGTVMHGVLDRLGQARVSCRLFGREVFSVNVEIPHRQDADATR